MLKEKTRETIEKSRVTVAREKVSSMASAAILIGIRHRYCHMLIHLLVINPIAVFLDLALQFMFKFSGLSRDLSSLGLLVVTLFLGYHFLVSRLTLGSWKIAAWLLLNAIALEVVISFVLFALGMREAPL